MRELEPFFATFQPHVYAVEGTMRAILEHGLLRRLRADRLHPMPSGRLGGLVDLGAAVVGAPVAALEGTFGAVSGRVARALGHRVTVDCVLYLLDPYDATSALPETLALKRECVVAGKPFLATHAAATGWFNLLAAVSECPGFVEPELAARLGLTGFPRRAIALVAHDGVQKREMLEFALDNYDLLDEFRERFGTGTTATLLNGLIPDRLKRDIEETHAYIDLFTALKLTPPPGLVARRDEMAALVAAAEKLRRRHKRRTWVKVLESGPSGGDLQAGEAIIMNLCDVVLFFEDPLCPHEHNVDIEVFERAARVSNRPERAGRRTLGVMCLHDTRSAAGWAALRRAIPDDVPVTLVAAYRQLLGVDLVLPPWGAPKTWKSVVEAAARYVITAIAASAQAAAEDRRSLRVAISSGLALHEVVRAIATVAGRTNRRAQALKARLDDQQRGAQSLVASYPPAVAALIADMVTRRRLLEHFAGTPLPACWKPDNVAVAPMTGAFGSSDPMVEANFHARELCELLEGARCLQLAASPFVRHAHHRPADPAIAEVDAHWGACDMVVMTCAALDKQHAVWFGGRAAAAMPAGLCAEMVKAEATGHIGGLFIGRSGRLPESKLYDRLGMTAKQIRRVAAAAHRPKRACDAILIASAEAGANRLPTIAAALEARLVSTLITDVATAEALLAEVRVPTPGGDAR